MGRPFIHINFAAEDAGGSDVGLAHAGNISCCADWHRVHELRERYDAIAVGGRTWNLDRPRLTVRAERLGREPRRQPSRVVFAGSHPCDIPPGARAFVVSSHKGVDHDVVTLTMASHDLQEPLASLHEHGIESLLVEGGPMLLRSFLRQGLADAMTVFVRAGTAEAADRGVRDSLGALPDDFRVRAFGEGFLLEAGRIEAVAVS
ncbi:MAG: dihydrofolate reductase family protein [Pseudomonadota bacterium]|uniref:RibD family protein n=1 Tax=Sphingomonas sp. ERG5 TaxID=1381597 RepID=UPI000691C80E|nr:dihydrofolate reductase family protein [Sphingomonas sp. ERG5]